MPKVIPQSFVHMANSDLMQNVLDRTASLHEVIPNVLDHWRYDLYTRSPGPAYFDPKGNLRMTDLDLACFMSALTDRHAVIDLPTYTSRRAPTIRQGEVVVSKEHRHGKITGLSANADVFSFSVKIFDANVIVAGQNGLEDSVGAYRNYMLVDIDGEWYDGWKSIHFIPSSKENDFLNDKKLWTGHTIHFKNFVHPNRWSAFYGSHYLLLKTLIARIEEQNKFLRSEVKRLLSVGITFPSSGEGSKKFTPATTTGPSKPITVEAFECEIDAPFRGEYEFTPASQSHLVEISSRLHTFQYDILPKLRFHARATELAFVKHGGLEAGFPHWIEGAKWEVGYRVSPRSRTDWDRLVLHQAQVGQIGFALRCRTYAKTEQVALNS